MVQYRVEVVFVSGRFWNPYTPIGKDLAFDAN